jgi:hypothetical protein
MEQLNKSNDWEITKFVTRKKNYYLSSAKG